MYVIIWKLAYTSIFGLGTLEFLPPPHLDFENHYFGPRHMKKDGCDYLKVGLYIPCLSPTWILKIITLARDIWRKMYVIIWKVAYTSIFGLGTWEFMPLPHLDFENHYFGPRPMKKNDFMWFGWLAVWLAFNFQSNLEGHTLINIMGHSFNFQSVCRRALLKRIHVPAPPRISNTFFQMTPAINYIVQVIRTCSFRTHCHPQPPGYRRQREMCRNRPFLVLRYQRRHASYCNRHNDKTNESGNTTFIAVWKSSVLEDFGSESLHHNGMPI